MEVARPEQEADAARHRRLFLALRRAITATFTDGNWGDLGMLTGTTEIINTDPRLFQALAWGDDDYESAVGRVLGEITEVFSIDALVSVVEDLIDLDTWIRDNQPQLYRELFAGGEAAAISEIEALAIAKDIPEINKHVARIRHSIDADPEQAVGSAKELVETACRAILNDHSDGRPDDIQGLVKRVRQHLGLDAQPGGNSLTRILSGHAQIIQGIGEFRNAFGTGHGRAAGRGIDTAAARLVVDSASTLTLYYLTLWSREQRNEGSPK